MSERRSRVGPRPAWHALGTLGAAVSRYRLTLARYLGTRFGRVERVAGPPPGLPPATLDAWCAEHLGARVASCAHRHLSGWKAHGTFRVHVVAENGRELSVIFKDELYSADAIPALDGLPVLPGPPEAYLYRQAQGTALAGFLPILHWHAEVEQGRHFRYLLEDLGRTHRKIRKDRDDLLRAVEVLVEAQRAMDRALAWQQSGDLIRYDQAYWARLLDYCRWSLEAYQQRVRAREIEQLMQGWSRLESFCLSDEWHGRELCRPIHGDYNRSNIHLRIGAGQDARIVDWEWAGIGAPHADLAALLKGAAPAVEREALAIFARAYDQRSLEEHGRLFRWCRLGRRLLDAGFLARQPFTSERQVPWIRVEVRRAVADVVEGARDLR